MFATQVWKWGSGAPLFYPYSSCRSELRQMAVNAPFPEDSHRHARRAHHFLHFTPGYLRTILKDAQA
jgi:hypothetical protein